MLILTRRTGTSILIEQDKIKIQVLETKGNQVRLGIKAPKDISILREEVYDRKKNN